MTLSINTDLSLALAEIRPVLRDRRFWAALLGIGLVLGVAGPFGTLTSLPLPGRLAYWIVIVTLTGIAGFACCHAIAGALRQRGLPQIPAALIAGLANALPINGIVLGFNALVLAPGDVALSPTRLALANTAISLAASLAVSLAFFADRAPAPAPRFSAAPRLRDRLPVDLRAPLVSIEATGHYTRITTTAGTTQILLRFSDAVAETAPVPGLRLHRSHWVALDQVATARRDGPRALVTLTDGRALPVSRANVRALEEAGLLPPR